MYCKGRPTARTVCVEMGASSLQRSPVMAHDSIYIYMYAQSKVQDASGTLSKESVLAMDRGMASRGGALWFEVWHDGLR